MSILHRLSGYGAYLFALVVFVGTVIGVYLLLQTAVFAEPTLTNETIRETPKAQLTAVNATAAHHQVEQQTRVAEAEMTATMQGTPIQITVESFVTATADSKIQTATADLQERMTAEARLTMTPVGVPLAVISTLPPEAPKNIGQGAREAVEAFTNDADLMTETWTLLAFLLFLLLSFGTAVFALLRWKQEHE